MGIPYKERILKAFVVIVTGEHLKTHAHLPYTGTQSVSQLIFYANMQVIIS